jgi:hypothetical protein
MADVVEYEYGKMDDADLIRLLRQRKMHIPSLENGFLDKGTAVKHLNSYDRSRRQDEERVWVTFHESSHPSAGPYVFAAVNNKTIQVPFGKMVCIPKYFLTECIDRAVITEYKQEFMPDGRAKTTQHRIPTYPYTIHRVATEEEVKEVTAEVRRKAGRPKKTAVGLSGEELSQAV